MRNYLPSFVGIALQKSEFCFCTGISPYQLRQLIKTNEKQLRRLGYTQYSKILMPSVTLYLLEITGLQIDIDLYDQCRKKVIRR